MEQDAHKLTFSSIMKCNADFREIFYNNIVCSDGTTIFESIAERLQKEIKALVPDSMTIRFLHQKENI